LLLWILSGTTNAETIESCDSWKNRLKSEHHLIKDREIKLSIAIEKDYERYRQGYIDHLINTHHQEIDLHNQQLASFRQSCSNTIQSIGKKSSGKSAASSVNEDSKSGGLLKSPNGYFIQLGAFKHKQNANNLKDRLDGIGITNRLIRKRHVYAVWAGPLNTIEEANKSTEYLRSKHNIGFDSYIIYLK